MEGLPSCTDLLDISWQSFPSTLIADEKYNQLAKISSNTHYFSDSFKGRVFVFFFSTFLDFSLLMMQYIYRQVNMNPNFCTFSN